MTKRNFNKYKLVDDGKVLYYGITKNPVQERAAQHESEGKHFNCIVKVGSQVSKQTAENWEENMLANFRQRHHGRNPKYNKTDK